MPLLCPCGSQRDFAACCQPYLLGQQPAPTPEALMRSRFSAFVTANWSYVVATWHPEQRPEGGEAVLANDSLHGRWLTLQVLDSAIATDGHSGWVRFCAWYQDRDGLHGHHEESQFVRLDGRWVYTQGQFFALPKSLLPGPNAPCPCGSGKKLKKCCRHIT